MVTEDSLEKMEEVYLSISLLWYTLTILWLVNICRFRKLSAILQAYMCVPLFCKVISCTLFYIYWSKCDLKEAAVSSSGLQCDRIWIAAIALCFTVGYAFSSIHILILISKGWSITRLSLTQAEKRLTSAATTCFAVSTMLYHTLMWILPSLKATVVLLIYLLLMLLTYIAILRLIFVSIDRNMRALKAQLYLIRQAGVDPASTPAMDKFLMFRSYQRCMATYVFLDILVVVLHNLLELDEWMVTLLNEIVEFFLILGVCITFRVKPFNTYFAEVPDQPMDDVSVPQNLTDEDMQGSELPQWEEGDPLPPVPHYMFPEQPANTVVVVVNPDTTDENGQRQQSVSVGYLHDPKRRRPLLGGSNNRVVPSMLEIFDGEAEPGGSIGEVPALRSDSTSALVPRESSAWLGDADEGDTRDEPSPATVTAADTGVVPPEQAAASSLPTAEADAQVPSASSSPAISRAPGASLSATSSPSLPVRRPALSAQSTSPVIARAPGSHRSSPSTARSGAALFATMDQDYVDDPPVDPVLTTPNAAMAPAIRADITRAASLGRTSGERTPGQPVVVTAGQASSPPSAPARVRDSIP